MNARTAEIRPDIQGIRALAVILVVLYHAGGVLGAGFIGVDIFFVISGFVIMSSVQRRWESDGEFSALDFLGRRVKRLFPALAAVVGVTMIFTPWLATVSSLTQTIRTGLFSSVSAANVFLFRFRPDGYFEVAEKSNALLHMWSLSVEEQFYLGFALLLAVFLGLTRSQIRGKTLAVVLTIVATSSFVLCAYIGLRDVTLPAGFGRLLGTSQLDRDFNFYLPLSRAWEFIAGMLLAMVRIGRRQNRWPRSVAVVVLFASSILLISDQSRYPGIITTLPVVMTLVLIGSCPVGGIVGALLTSRPMVYIGDRSYSWYLWHWPIIQFANPLFPDNRLALLVAAGASLLPAIASYRFLEQRYMHRDLSAVRIAFLAILPIVIAATAFVFPFKPFPELSLHLDAERGCESGDPSLVERTSKCTLEVSGSSGQAILLGDSHAGQLAEGFVAAAHELNLDATIAVRAGKPLLASSERSLSPGEDDLIDAVVDEHPKIVVIAQSRYPSLLPEDLEWRQVFMPVVAYFSARSIPVVVVNSSSVIGIDPRSCSWLAVKNGRCDSDVAALRENVARSVEASLVDERAAIKNSSAVLVDLLDIFCDESVCPARQDGKWMWRDSSHMSRYASTLTAPLLRQAMEVAMAGN